jgi:hypothetical protein
MGSAREHYRARKLPRVSDPYADQRLIPDPPAWCVGYDRSFAIYRE